MELLQKICSFLAWILGVYSTVILIRIIVSWILLFARRSSWRNGNGFNPENPDGPGPLASVDSILGKICDPYLKAFSGVTSLKRSNIDLTPLLALVVLNFVRSVLGMFATVGQLNLWTVLAIFVNGIWYSFFTFILVALIILLIIRLVLASQEPTHPSGRYPVPVRLCGRTRIFEDLLQARHRHDHARMAQAEFAKIGHLRPHPAPRISGSTGIRQHYNARCCGLHRAVPTS